MGIFPKIGVKINNIWNLAIIGFDGSKELVTEMIVTSSKLTLVAGKWTRLEDEFPIEDGDVQLATLVYQRVTCFSSRVEMQHIS